MHQTLFTVGERGEQIKIGGELRSPKGQIDPKEDLRFERI